MVTIPKLESQWKISLLLQPAWYESRCFGLLTTTDEGDQPVIEILTSQHKTSYGVKFTFQGGPLFEGRVQSAWFTVPLQMALGAELTKTEITHERDEEGNYTLTVSVGDQKMDMASINYGQFLSNLTNIKIDSPDRRELVVLDKP